MKDFHCNQCLHPVEIYCRWHRLGVVLRYVCPCCGPIHSRTGLPYKPYTPVKAQGRKINATKYDGGNDAARN